MENLKKKISIITINLNNREGLEKTVASILSQVDRDFEWVVIDGGSYDGSLEILNRNKEYFDYWISEPDNGIFSGMNKGITNSHGEFLLFLNSGDVFIDENVVLKINSNIKNDDFYVGQIKYRGKNISIDLSSKEKMYYHLLRYGFPHQATVIKSSLFRKLGLYREDYKVSSDWVFNLKAIINGNATVVKLPFIISEFDPHGVSSNPQMVNYDKDKMREETPGLCELMEFYIKYFKIINLIKHNRFIHFIGIKILRILKF